MWGTPEEVEDDDRKGFGPKKSSSSAPLRIILSQLSRVYLPFRFLLDDAVLLPHKVFKRELTTADARAWNGHFRHRRDPEVIVSNAAEKTGRTGYDFA